MTEAFGKTMIMMEAIARFTLIWRNKLAKYIWVIWISKVGPIDEFVATNNT